MHKEKYELIYKYTQCWGAAQRQSSVLHTHICTCTDTHTQLQAHMNAHSGVFSRHEREETFTICQKRIAAGDYHNEKNKPVLERQLSFSHICKYQILHRCIKTCLCIRHKIRPLALLRTKNQGKQITVNQAVNECVKITLF